MPSEPPLRLPPPPLPPSEDDCCHSDCGAHCVFDHYQRQLERWQETCDSLRSAASH